MASSHMGLVQGGMLPPPTTDTEVDASLAGKEEEHDPNRRAWTDVAVFGSKCCVNSDAEGDCCL
jgi:hypothetical protein